MGNQKQIYDVDYFIRKFEAIPEDRWITAGRHSLDGQRHCAHGWCDINNSDRETDEEKAFSLLAENNFSIVGACGFGFINNGSDENYRQTTPKQRILAALQDIKKLSRKQNLEVCDATKADSSARVDITKNLAILPVDETSDLKKRTY